MKLFKSILFFYILLCTSLIALPTVTGPTGLITLPTAEILNYKQYNSAFDYQQDLYSYKVNVGALENTELGFVGGSEPDEGVFLNFKWSLSANTGRFPLKMAIGFENITSSTQSDFYIVSSKKLAANLGVHGGFKALFSNSVEISFMTGLDYARNDNLIFMADFNSLENNLYYVNMGVAYNIFNSEVGNNLYLKGTLENLLRNKGKDTFFNIGIAYTSIM